MTDIPPEVLVKVVQELELVRELAKRLGISEELAAQLRGNVQAREVNKRKDV